MIIVSVSVIRNEADIIETFVRYHQQIVDHMVIIDHRSLDSTGEILDNMKKEGLRLEILENHSLRQPQKSALNDAIKLAVQKFGADWVLPLDADEFVCSSVDKSVNEIVAEMPGNLVINIPWRSYIPLASDNANEPNILERVRHRRKIEGNQTYKVLIPRKLAKNKRGILGFGSHHYKLKNLYSRKKIGSVNTDQLHLAHFPVRDADQVKTKAIMGWLSVLAKPDRGHAENIHLKKLYDRFADSDSMEPEEITKMAYSSHTDETSTAIEEDLVCSPVIPPASEIRLLYRNSARCEPTRLLYKMAEEYAEAVSNIKTSL